LESRWETKLAALAEAEAALATARAVKPALPDHDALLALAADLPRLWDAETTSPRDRKRLLRTLVADVTLLPELDAETVRVGVRWHTGASDELTVERRGPAAHHPRHTATTASSEASQARCRPPEYPILDLRTNRLDAWSRLHHGERPGRCNRLGQARRALQP
jgi:hypothetical protein